MPFLLILFGIFLYIYCEISLLVSIGSHIGILPLMLLLIGISVLGLWFVKLRGLYAIYSVRSELSQGKIPTQAVISSLLFILAGIFLIIPGFLSDIIAILLMLPVTRHIVERYLLKFFKTKVRVNQFASGQFSQQNSNTFEAEFERKQDQDKWIK
ncbi:FxsA family protein [Actinobacillus vicugnae]|uniref:FxsA family protein n=1 Tax=Actinobacillus vicugnae TaxID=2573093 RepID=UPI00123EF0AD|nr:FxsA family protein [Actinobacillus vicugnae]